MRCVSRARRVSAVGRRGFTQLELLTAFSIITLLAALLIPAINSAREASRRTVCQSNLRAFGQALGNFESAHRRFPAVMPQTGTLQAPSGAVVPYSRRHVSVHAQLLPYLEQSPLYGHFEFLETTLVSGDLGELPEFGDCVVTSFLCPSDAIDFGTNYRVCTGAGPRLYDDVTGWQGGGAFSEMRGLQASAFTDGLSQTVAASEHVKAVGTQDLSDGGAFWYSGVSDLVKLRDLSVQDAQALMVEVCGAGQSGSVRVFPYAGHTWFWSFYDYTCYNHVVGPNSAIPDCTSLSNGAGHVASSFGIHKASSAHPGGVNVLLMDGRVLFIADLVELRIWRAIATHSGHEIVGDTVW